MAVRNLSYYMGMWTTPRGVLRQQRQVGGASI